MGEKIEKCLCITYWLTTFMELSYLTVMSNICNFIHIVFRTYCSRETIPDENKRILLAYIYRMCQDNDVHLERVNAYRNHVHLLVNLPATISISDFVKRLKQASSLKFKGSDKFPYFEGWGKWFGCFSVSYYDKDKVANYIANQKVHHARRFFRDEYVALLHDYGMEENEFTFVD